MKTKEERLISYYRNHVNYLWRLYYEKVDMIAKLESKLERAVEAIKEMQTASDAMMLHIARTTLEELNGDKK
jgi:biotin carboxylase